MAVLRVNVDTTAIKDPPRAPFTRLETLWIQVTGTVCNLACSHCFISCGPENRTHELMSRKEVGSALLEGERLGVKEFYFTGGEPFLHPDIIPILQDALAIAPTSVLTNGLLLTPPRVAELARARDDSRYSLEIRVSVDGWSAAQHDAIRGPGTFDRTIAAAKRLEDADLLPIITTTEIWTRERDGSAGAGAYGKLKEALEEAGIRRPRIKIIPLFDLGRGADIVEADAPIAARSKGPLRATEMDPAFDWSSLQCTSSRIVTSRGVFTCPLLINEPCGRWEGALEGSLADFDLVHTSCRTCVVTGMTCKNW